MYQLHFFYLLLALCSSGGRFALCLAVGHRKSTDLLGFFWGGGEVEHEGGKKKKKERKGKNFLHPEFKESEGFLCNPEL